MHSELDCEKSLKLAQIAYAAYGEATDFKNFGGEPMPAWEELPEQIQKEWCHGAIAASTQPPSPLKCRWLVEAGVAGAAIPKYSRVFYMTTSEDSALNNSEMFQERLSEVLEYTRRLSEPGLVNWVNLKFVWH